MAHRRAVASLLRRPFGRVHFCSARPTVSRDERVTGLDDGSESTLGQAGHFTGPWDPDTQRPHGGVGTMRWDNGITYEGEWHDGKFHGHGSKMYSRGGGYEGAWVQGRRQGPGVQIFAGKFGYERWAGPFLDDKPHGVGVMHFSDGTQGEFEFDGGKPKPTAAGDSAASFDGRVSSLDDGSPSTVGVPGHYTGAWDHAERRPHGFGIMRWDNGIEFKGMWKDGVYHGHGRKLYSRGGGYEGAWVKGKREGHGITFYDEGKAHGILRWEGPFVNDKPHGSGQAYVKADMEDEHGRWSGDTAVKGPVVVFDGGKPLNLPGGS